MTNLTAIKGDTTVRLLEACRVVELVDGVRCPIGEARITEAGNLDASYVIHTVGPRYNILYFLWLPQTFMAYILRVV